MADLGRVWSPDNNWRQSPLSTDAPGTDGRTPRSTEPVYQTAQDRLLAESNHDESKTCSSCVGIDVQLPETAAKAPLAPI